MVNSGQDDKQRKVLADALIDALCLTWHDNGNLSADATRDRCVTVVAECIELKYDEVVELVYKRILEYQ